MKSDHHGNRPELSKGSDLTTHTNRVALLTGAGSGIGRAIALALAAQDMELWLVGRNLERLEAIANAARGTVGACRCIQLDLVCDEEIITLAVRLRRDTGHVDLLVHSAGEIILGCLPSIDRCQDVVPKGAHEDAGEGGEPPRVALSKEHIGYSDIGNRAD